MKIQINNHQNSKKLILTQNIFNFIKLTSLLNFTKIPLIYILKTKKSLQNLLTHQQKYINKLIQKNKIFQNKYKILQQIKKTKNPTNINLLNIQLLYILIKNFNNIPNPKNK